MEDFTASPEPSLNLRLEKLAECDIYLGIIGHDYGSYVAGEDRSYTELEYDESVKRSIPAYVFVTSEEFRIAAKDANDDVKREKQQAFRARLSEFHTHEKFLTTDDLSRYVTRALQDVHVPQEQQLAFVVSSGGTHGVVATPGFQGYIVVECDFPHARGLAMVTDEPIGHARIASSYVAEIICRGELCNKT
jgi:hypothetical protein